MSLLLRLETAAAVFAVGQHRIEEEAAVMNELPVFSACGRIFRRLPH